MFRAKAQIWHAKKLSIRGRLHFILEMNDKASIDFNRAATFLSQITLPASSEMISIIYDVQLGNAYIKAKQKKYAEAIKHLDEVQPQLKVEWQKNDILGVRGWLKLLLKDDSGAIADLQAAFEKQTAMDKEAYYKNKRWYDDNPHIRILTEDATRTTCYEAMVFAKSNPKADQREVRFHSMECIFKWGLINSMASLPAEVMSLRPPQQVKELDEVLLSDPTCKVALHVRGGLYKDTGKYVNAIEDYLAAGCESYVAYLRSLKKVQSLALQYEEEIFKKYGANDVQAAIKQADIVLLLDPTFAYGYSMRGLCKGVSGNTKEGLTDCERALNLDPKDGVHFYRRALVYQRSGFLEAAAIDFKKAIELGENAFSPIALANLNDELKKNEEKKRQQQEEEAERKHLEKEEAIRRQKAEEQEHRLAQEQEKMLNRKIEEELRRKQEEQTEINDFHQALTKLKNARKNNTKDLRTLDKEYRELENKAFKYKSAEFFAERGDFYDTSAQKESNAIRKNVLYNNALKDYLQVLNFDSFAENIPEKIEQIETRLNNGQSVGVNRNILLSKPQPTATLPKREELTQDQLKELEEMKEKLRQQKISGGVKPTQKI